jgi:hypothetical protein
MNNARPNPARFFHAGAAIFMLVLVFVGFQLFYLHGKAYPGRPLTPAIRTVVIVHGIAMTAWMVLYLVQSLLIARGNRRAHLFLGKIGAVLAIAVTYSGVRVALGSASVNPPEAKLWGLEPRQFLAVSLGAIVPFAIYVAIGVWKRKRPEVHRAMMLLGTLVASVPAVDRITDVRNLYEHHLCGAIFGPFFPAVVIGAVFFLVKGALTRSFDRAYAWGYAALVLIGPVAMNLAKTPAWAGVAHALLR